MPGPTNRRRCSGPAANARDQLVGHLDDNPGFKARLPEAMAAADRYARRDAANETCPWPFEDIVAEDFWPGDGITPPRS